MTRKVISTTQIKDWKVSVEINLYDDVEYPSLSGGGRGGEIAAYLTTYPVDSKVDAGSDNVEVMHITENDEEQVDIAERTPPSDTPSISKYEVVIRDTRSRTPVKVCIGDGVSDVISIPRIEFLKSVKEIREFDSKTATQIKSIVTSNYPQDNDFTAMVKFNKDCVKTLPIKEHIPLLNEVVKIHPDINEYGGVDKRAIGKHAFEIGEISYTHTGAEIGAFDEVIHLYNEQDRLDSVTRNEAIRQVLFDAFKNGDFDSVLQEIKEGLVGETWEQCLTDYNQLVLTILLIGNGYENAARQINSHTDLHMEKDEYETEKNRVQRLPDEDQAMGWGELLPVTVNDYSDDFDFITANIAYWVAGDLNVKYNEIEMASEIYKIAEEKLSEHGSTRFAAVAKLREKYLKGLFDRRENREADAVNALLNVIREWGEYDGFCIDAYSVLGSVEQLINLEIELFTKGDNTIEDVIDVLECVNENIPSEDQVPERAVERQNNTMLFVKGALAEFTGRKLKKEHTSMSEPVNKQVSHQFTTAAEKYESCGRSEDEDRVKELIHNLGITPSTV